MFESSNNLGNLQSRLQRNSLPELGIIQPAKTDRSGRSKSKKKTSIGDPYQQQLANTNVTGLHSHRTSMQVQPRHVSFSKEATSRRNQQLAQYNSMKDLRDSELSIKMATARNSHNASTNTDAIGQTRVGDSSAAPNSRRAAQDRLFPEIVESSNDVSSLY